MNIAIVGTGISGLTAAYMLHKTHDIEVFEANDYIGGHTHTVDVDLEGKTYNIDTGFIVYNDWTYPKFIRLLDKLGVSSQPSSMSFSVKSEKTGLGYNGTSLNSLFAQRSNLLRPKFWQMIKEILRFNKQSKALLASGKISKSMTLGVFLRENAYSEAFIQHYIIPMGAAIWSASEKDIHEFPLQFFLQFFANHGMLNIKDRPQWRVIQGGSKQYIKKLIKGFDHKIHLRSPVSTIQRHEDYVEVKVNDQALKFDAVVIATHSNQALKLLIDPSSAESDILSNLPYQENEVVLHTDTSVLPKRKLAWASWNYFIPEKKQGRVMLTYNMNILQSINAPETFCVTLNNTEAINPNKMIQKFIYHHPIYSESGIKAQQRYYEISGINRTYYCGAYWRNGFHEDGVVSGLNVASMFGESMS